MSLFRPTSITCPSCDALIETQESDSVNADRRPDLRDEILNGTFQSLACPSCGDRIRLEPQFNYLEVGQNLWIAAFPPRMMPDYLQVEDDITQIFDNAYGKHAQPSARAIGDDLDLRLVFGWPALREKLVLRSAGLDDVVVEMLKLDLMRRLPQADLGPGRELRVLHADDEALSFAWVLPDAGAEMDRFAADRALYDAIADNAEGWAPVRAQLTNGPFVDMQKLFMGQGRDAAE